PCAGGSGDGEVLGAVDPLQGRQRGLGRGGDRGGVLLPGIEGLPGRQASALATHRLGGRVPASDFLGEQDAQYFGGVPALGLRGGQRVRGGSAEVGHPQAFQDRGEVLGQRRGRHRRGDSHRVVAVFVVVVNPAQLVVPGWTE